LGNPEALSVLPELDAAATQQMKIITIALLIALTLVELAQAGDRKRRESKNYILRRQQAYKCKACQRLD
jgi:hypothetical protein